MTFSFYNEVMTLSDARRLHDPAACRAIVPDDTIWKQELYDWETAAGVRSPYDGFALAAAKEKACVLRSHLTFPTTVTLPRGSEAWLRCIHMVRMCNGLMDEKRYPWVLLRWTDGSQPSFALLTLLVDSDLRFKNSSDLRLQVELQPRRIAEATYVAQALA